MEAERKELRESGRADESERRSSYSVAFVRDWITSLRTSGGDFQKQAAVAAARAAYEAQRGGRSREEIFETARRAYYESLGKEALSA